MKTRFLRSAAALLLCCALALTMTGCSELDYRKALNLYNSENFDAAAEAFYALGDYEDSAELFTRSHYWAAVVRMEQGNYAEALPRFLKLGDYEDSALRSTECKYQLAISALEADDLATAKNHFEDVADYKQAGEYLRRITWQAFFDAVTAAGTENDGCFTLERGYDGRVYRLTADPAEPNRLILSVSHSQDLGYTFYDDLSLTLTRDSTDASFAAVSTFSMDFGEGQIGSSQSGSGTVDITACTADTVLVMDTFEKTVTDNLGKTTASTDPADSLMDDTMAENLAALLSTIPNLLTESGITLTLADIGFYIYS